MSTIRDHPSRPGHGRTNGGNERRERAAGTTRAAGRLDGFVTARWPGSVNPRNPRLSVSVVFVAGMFMTIMDSTVVNVALPTLRREFATSTASVSAVVTSYLVAVAVVMPASGWLGDRVGGKRLMLGALGLFTVASAACGAAASLPALVAFRAAQGAAAGLLIPIGMTMLYRTFPQAERIRATRLLMVPTLLAPALGPVLGGVIVDGLSWRWIFYINVPVGAARSAGTAGTRSGCRSCRPGLPGRWTSRNAEPRNPARSGGRGGPGRACR